MAKISQSSSQICSTAEIEDALKVLEGRWKALILFHLFRAPVLRFSELRRAIPGVSQKMLIQQLRDLEGDGVVVRKVYSEVPPKVEYALTEEGLALRPALVALKLWAASRKGNLLNPPTNISAANSNES
ncbi:MULTISPECIES: helix-turn-helix domain-containing protein [unclassified Bradyrhizobium]|jgi:DNA-binding HxlR family transcriptional regulator|uniref:winged helix-turn-helix transcriptional regulator n=1 Tax=unclassified Bradyrhizobium TaxID=2631580 RepID=UPI0005D2B215|nr:MULTISPECIES: helix-turn-helix domain-containing protein [unclassified Bradyrhizobium]